MNAQGAIYCNDKPEMLMVEMSFDEAQAIADVSRFIGGSKETTDRKYWQNMNEALKKIGINGRERDSIGVTGTIRYKSTALEEATRELASAEPTLNEERDMVPHPMPPRLVVPVAPGSGGRRVNRSRSRHENAPSTPAEHSVAQMVSNMYARSILGTVGNPVPCEATVGRAENSVVLSATANALMASEDDMPF